jgi:hypothetical protein
MSMRPGAAVDEIQPVDEFADQYLPEAGVNVRLP